MSADGIGCPNWDWGVGTSRWRPEMLLNTLRHTARLRPPTAEHRSAHRVVRDPLCSDFRLLRSFPCYPAGKTMIPTTRPLFPALLAVSFNPVTSFSLLQIFAHFLHTDYKTNICSLQTIANCKKPREPGERTPFLSPRAQTGRRCTGTWPRPCLRQVSCPSSPHPRAMNPSLYHNSLS